MKLSIRMFLAGVLVAGYFFSNLAGADVSPEMAAVETAGDVWSTATAGVLALLVLATRLRAR